MLLAMTTIADQLRADITAFLARTGMTPTEFGINALNNPAFWTKLKRGEDIRASTIDKVRRYMQEYDRPLARRTRRESRPAA